MSFEQAIGPRIKRISNAMDRKRTRDLEDLDLTSSQGIVLGYLVRNRESSISPGDIGKHFGLSHPTVTGILQRLESKDYIRYAEDAADRRRKRIEVTERALDCYQKAADLGNAEAVWYIGSFYEEGSGVEQNDALALDYYHKSAEQGDADAWMSIAYFHLRGKGVEEDHAKALEYYEKAASLGSNLACDYLGYLYMTGSLVPQDPAQGIEWYKKAAELGNARSMYALGYAYQSGQGVEISMEEALRWYEKAALAGHASALQVWKAYNSGK